MPEQPAVPLPKGATLIGLYFIPGPEVQLDVRIYGFKEKPEDPDYAFYEAHYIEPKTKVAVVLNDTAELTKYPSYHRVWRLLYNFLERMEAHNAIQGAAVAPAAVVVKADGAAVAAQAVNNVIQHKEAAAR